MPTTVAFRRLDIFLQGQLGLQMNKNHQDGVFFETSERKKYLHAIYNCMQQKKIEVTVVSW